MKGPLRETMLVTGASRGIGRATALELAAAGFDVVVHFHSDEIAAGRVAEEVRAAGADCRVLRFDAGDRQAARLALEGDIAGHGAYYGVVCNAGISRDNAFPIMSGDEWDAVLRTNLDSVFNLTKPLCEGMVERGWGRIVNISSVNGSKGQFGQTNYAAAKAGIHGFTKSLALEVARKGVTVNTVSPGYLATPMVMKVPKDILESRIISQIPVGRLGRPEEIAELVRFICSDAAAYMTGSNVAMNGGLHMC